MIYHSEILLKKLVRINENNVYFKTEHWQDTYNFHTVMDVMLNTYSETELIRNEITKYAFGLLQVSDFPNSVNCHDIGLIINGKIIYTVQLYDWDNLLIRPCLLNILTNIINIEYIHVILNLIMTGDKLNIELALSMKFAWLINI